MVAPPTVSLSVLKAFPGFHLAVVQISDQNSNWIKSYGNFTEMCYNMQDNWNCYTWYKCPVGPDPILPSFSLSSFVWHSHPGWHFHNKEKFLVSAQNVSIWVSVGRYNIPVSRHHVILWYTQQWLMFMLHYIIDRWRTTTVIKCFCNY